MNIVVSAACKIIHSSSHVHACIFPHTKQCEDLFRVFHSLISPSSFPLQIPNCCSKLSMWNGLHIWAQIGSEWSCTNLPQNQSRVREMWREAVSQKYSPPRNYLQMSFVSQYIARRKVDKTAWRLPGCVPTLLVRRRTSELVIIVDA